jgi:carbamoyl-phosphate synthase small subunit
MSVIPVQGDSEAGGWIAPRATALLVLADGAILEGVGFGATGAAAGEVCFNTAMTGYEEILTDPSYAGQIITFTFPHVGNVGTNEEDIETVNLAASAGARGIVLRAEVTDPSNFRATRRLDDWLKARGIIGLCGLDTRALATLIRVASAACPTRSSPTIPTGDSTAPPWRPRPPPGPASTAWIWCPA